MSIVLSISSLPAQNLLWIAAILSLAALVFSIAALRGSRRKPAESVSVAAAVPASAVTGVDPAVIAVLTAAVAMMLAAPSSQERTATSAVQPSVAGFTIRKVRRV